MQLKSESSWKPSKYVSTSSGLRGSRDRRELNVGSRLVADRIAAAYESAIRRYARGALLDLGCGKAPLYGVYRPLVSMVTCADREQSLHGSDFVDVPCDLESALPFADRTFDTVLATDVLEHVPDPFLFWREVSRVTAPGGHVILGVPFLYWLHEMPHDHYRFTSFSLERFCLENGFEVRLIEAYGGSVAVVLDIIGKHMRPDFLSAAYQAIAGVILRGASRLDRRTQQRFPLGYTLVAQRRSD